MTEEGCRTRARARKPLTKPIKVEGGRQEERRGVTGDFTTIIRNGWVGRPRQRMLFQRSHAAKEDAATEQGKEVWTVSLSPLFSLDSKRLLKKIRPTVGWALALLARIAFLPRSFSFFAVMVRIGWSEFAN